MAKNNNRVKTSESELKEKMVAINRVAKVTKGGRTFSFAAIVVVGDENGVVGHGLGKSKDVSEAIAKAVEDAKKNLVRIPLSGQSVPHEQKGKFGGAAVFLMPASHGTGVIAGGAVRSVLESVGIHDVLSKSQGSSNPHNVVKATFDALLQMRSAVTVAKQRGISLEKVFKG
jgi:small subunit ribosomal protein S5